MTPEINAASERYAAHLEAEKSGDTPKQSPYWFDDEFMRGGGGVNNSMMELDAHTLARAFVAAPAVQPSRLREAAELVMAKARLIKVEEAEEAFLASVKLAQAYLAAPAVQPFEATKLADEMDRAKPACRL